MILPQTYAVALLLSIVGAICLGSWANTFKAARWRFELYYFDFSFGLAITALILAFTAGTMGFDGFTFLDDLTHAAKRAWLYAFLAGAVFNLANMFLLAAVAVAGMAVAFPISAGLALIIGVGIAAVQRPAGNPWIAFAGCILVFASIVAAGAAYRFITQIRHEASAKAGKAKSTRRPVAVKGIALAVLSGIPMSVFYPLLASAREGELGLGPYSVCALLAAGALFSTVVFNLFFMNLPVEGEPVDFLDYFRGSPRSHAFGALGGAIWCLGAVAALVALSGDNVHISAALSQALGQSPALIAVLWGVLLWKELRDGNARAKALIAFVFMLFALGVTLLSLAQALSRSA